MDHAPLMNQLGIVERSIERADAQAAARLGEFGVSTIHEAMGRVGLMKPYMRPIYAGAHACGTAVTVLMHPGDNWMLHVAAEQIGPGDIDQREGSDQGHIGLGERSGGVRRRAGRPGRRGGGR